MSLKFFLIIISAFLSILLLTFPSNAFEDGFQYYPGGVTTGIWTLTGSMGVSANGDTTYGRGLATSGGSSCSPSCNSVDGSATMSSYINTNYVAFNAKTLSFSSDCNGFHNTQMIIYDSTGVAVLTYEMIPGTYGGSSSGTTGLWELLMSGNNIMLRINGVDIGIIGTSTHGIGYLKFVFHLQHNCSGGTSSSLSFRIDDVSTSGYISQIGTEATTHTLTESNLAPMNISYTINTFPFATYTTDYVSNIIQKYTGSTPITIINTTIKASGNSATFQGSSNYNRKTQLTSNDTNYGLYFSYTQKNNVTVASDYFFLSPPGAVNSITTADISAVIGQTEPITYSIGAPDFSGSSYSVNVYSLSALVKSFPITSATGTVNWDTTGNSAGLYFITLSKTTSGIQTDIAYTTITLVSTLLLKGTVYDAQNATVISGVNINVSQGGSWFNTTTAADGSYNLSGLFVSINTNINASKSGYTHNNFSFTPLAPKVYTVNLYMISNGLNCSVGATTNTCIVGITEDYPYHQAVPGATVNLSNATYFVTTTSNASTGFYIFQNLSNDNLTYIVNASKSGYQNSLDYSVTTTNQTFKTQIIIMNAIYTLTVVAQDSTNANTILNFLITFNGNLSNTTVGTISFPGITYGQYSTTVSANGYLTSTQNILVDSTKTVTFILTPITTTSSTTFKTLPHNVRFLVQDYAGNPYSGITITVQGFNTTVGTFQQLALLLGLDFGQTPINNATMTGITGIDGSSSFMMVDTIFYHVNFNAGSSFNITWNLYPKEDFYTLMVPIALPNTGCAFNNVTANLTDATINSTHTALGLAYVDTSNTTTLINFFVQDNQSNYLYTVNSTNSSFSPSFIVNSTAGKVYFWGYNATITGCNLRSQTQVISFRGSGRFIDLHISDIYYQWISIIIIVFVAALFSIKKMKFGAVMVPLTASIVYVFGWFTINPILLAIAIVLGILVYLRQSEQKVIY